MNININIDLFYIIIKNEYHINLLKNNKNIIYCLTFLNLIVFKINVLFLKIIIFNFILYKYKIDTFYFIN